jgi:hypothetical protein
LGAALLPDGADCRSIPASSEPPVEAFMKCSIPVAATFLVLALAADLFAAYTTVFENGPASNRVNMVFLGDGYTASQIDTNYVADINKYLNHLFHENQDPFTRYEQFFNAYRINVVSSQSGADVPPQGIYRDTALDASYYWDTVTDRLLYVNSTKATNAMNAGLAGSGITADMKLVTVNDTRYGGGGGSYAVYAGGNSSAPEVALHETGHSFSGLADEYTYGGADTYTGSEPSAVNATKDSTGAKWSQWLGYVDPDHPELGAVGAYEGAMYSVHGIYRPTSNSKMRSLGVAFNAVSREKIILDIYQQVKPIDSFLANTGTLTDPLSLWIDVVDPAVLKVQWSVDGIVVPDAASESFDPLRLAPGSHTITAKAYDDTPWVRLTNNLLSQSINWSVNITLVSWTKDADGLFTEAGSWSSGSVPQTTDDVVISGPVTVNDSSPITEIRSLQLVDGATLTCNSLVADSLKIGGVAGVAVSAAPVTAVPEPGALILLLSGAMFFGVSRLRSSSLRPRRD